MMSTLGTATIATSSLLVACVAQAAGPIEIGSRLEPFVDAYLIAELSGGARLEMHRPTEREAAIVHDQPWEGNASLYHTVFQDGDLYRVYYRGSHLTVGETSLGKAH